MSQQHQHCDKHCCAIKTDANLADPIPLEKKEILSKTTSSVLPRDDPARLCNNERCENLGSNKCARCRLWTYCSRECQKVDWASHKGECKKFGEPPHTPMTVAEARAEARAGRNVDRPEVFMNRTVTKDPVGQAKNLVRRMYYEYNFRIGYFGAARLGKAVFFLKNADDCENFVNELKELGRPGSLPMMGAFNWDAFGERYHERMSTAERKRISDEFMKEDSKIRLLAVSPHTDVDIIAPDVEIVAVLGLPKDREDIHDKLQRVAMKDGMRGEWVVLFPEWATGKFEEGDDVEDDDKKWQPLDWRSEEESEEE